MAVLRLEHVGKQFDIGTAGGYGRLSEVLDRAIRSVGNRLAPRSTPKDEPANRFWALRDVSFSVNAGEVVGIIGRNGAGKSTLLKIISRITTPTVGRYGIRGRLGCLLEVGTGFHPELTGRENILLNGAILGMSRREVRAKFDEIVDFAEVERFLDTPVKHYSSGMYIRLGFAVAAKLEPEILIVDEVLSVGDAAFQKKCLALMREVAQRGCTCLIVSHNLPTVSNLCDRALLLHAGQLVADGGPRDVVRRYLETIQGQGGEVVWNDCAAAPGNEVARLRSVRVLQRDDRQATEEVDITDDVVIEISYWNQQPDATLYCALLLRDHTGAVAFTTSSAKRVSLTDDAWAGHPHPPGLFRSVCRIPANFLNQARYFVTAMVGRNVDELLAVAEDAVRFDVHDPGMARGLDLGQWLGAVRPKLPWQTERIDSLPGHGQ